MSVELAKWIANEFGFKANFVNTSFYKAQEMILEGKADVITVFFYSEERDKKFDFTKTVFNIPASIFVSSSNSNIKEIKDLNDKNIAIQKGDYAISFLEKSGVKFKLTPTDSFINAADELIKGKVDALVGDEQVVLYYLERNNLSSKVKIAGKPLYIGLSSMAVKEGNKTIISILNKGIELAKQKGILK